ncbi:hypothetical protein HQ587_00895 [bacterium]|nr:hypothetical protein [bacterium]
MIDRTHTTAALLITLFSVIYLLIPADINQYVTDDISLLTIGETRFIEDLSECTTGLASGLATPDGRPLLWKNRDVGTWGQEYHYVDHGGIPFIGLTYENDIDDYYAGINAAGFAIENSDAHNLPGRNPGANGWGGDPDDGETMSLALSTCRTVDDFQDILDSLNDENIGRTDDFNYGTFDAFGGAAMFECDGYTYTRYDAADEEDGFLIRANFAFSGDDTAGTDYVAGVHRHDRSLMLWKEAVDNGSLTPHYIYQVSVRDLTSRECNASTLPYEDYYDEGWRVWPYGIVPNSTTVNRYRTRSVFVGQGVAEGDPPADAVIWAMTGNPIGSIFTPLWVRAGSVPEEYDADFSRICLLAHDLKNWVCELQLGVDTWRLCNPDGNGVYDYLLPLETNLYNRTIRFLNSPNFSYDQLEVFQNIAARQAADSIAAWRPFYHVTEAFEAIYEDNNLVLIWEENEEERFGRFIPRGYDIYRSSDPFREGERGELLASVEGTRFTDHDAPSGGAYYRIEVLF